MVTPHSSVFVDILPKICPSPLKLGHYFQRLKGDVMARKRHSDEDILKLLREIEVNDLPPLTGSIS